MTVETRERFLRAIAERIAPERIEELHLFPPLRQGGKESGVAVITVRTEEDVAEADGEGEGPEAAADEEPTEAAADEEAPEAAAHGELPETAAEEEAPDAAGAEPDEPAEPVARDGAGPVAGVEALEALMYDDASAGESEPDVPAPPPRRLAVYRASYRHTLKGPDRGKWEVEVIEEALAPAYTVDEVVRGVHERAGGDAEPEHLTGEGVRAAISEEPWTAAR